jgi:hypothetical protein
VLGMGGQASASRELPGTCDLVKNTACDGNVCRGMPQLCIVE